MPYNKGVPVLSQYNNIALLVDMHFRYISNLFAFASKYALSKPAGVLGDVILLFVQHFLPLIYSLLKL